MDKPKLNLKDHGKQLTCEKCNGETFSEAFFMFKVSKLLTGDAQDSLVPVPTFKCTSCGHINEEFALRKEEPKEA